MDVKTLLLLGAGMVVLSLVGFCSVQSRSAGLAVTVTQAAALEVKPGQAGARAAGPGGRTGPTAMDTSRP